jgi:hypothetical protein
MKYLFLIFSSITIYSQNIISGRVLSDNGFVVYNVEIVNMRNGSKALSNDEGYFKIEARTNDELRFLKENFERGSKVIQNYDFLTTLSIQLVRVPIQIEEVKVAMKPTGNLGKDASRIKIDHSKEILQKEIGLPQPKGIQREKVPVLTKDILLPLLTARLNIDAIYKVVSGKARKMKSLYKYEDMQRNINWITEHNGDEYFIEREIPKEKIREFLEFSILLEPQIAQNIKLNNLSAVNFELENTNSLYLGRLKKRF